MMPPNTALRRAPAAAPPSPVICQPLGCLANNKYRAVARPPLACLFLAVAAYACRLDCGGWYGSMSIDPATSTLAMHDPLERSGKRALVGFRDDVTQSGHSIEHYGAETPSGKHPRLNYFSTDSQYRLIYREKYQELLHGDFGSVYAQSTYYYDARYRGQATGFEVNGYSKLVGSESPSVTSSIPAESSGQVVAISLVRVLRAHPGFAVLSATYSPNGKLQSLSVDAARGGDWVGASEFVGSDPPINGGRFYGGGIQLRPWYGIPSNFPVQAYTANPTAVWPNAGYPEEFAAVHLHYDANRWVRQDTYVDGIRTESRNLHFPSTAQDNMLEPIDSHRGFGRWTRATWD
jgi:hypothetical protein